MKIKCITKNDQYKIPIGIEIIAGKGKYDNYIINELAKGVKVVSNNENRKLRLMVKEIIK